MVRESNKAKTQKSPSKNCLYTLAVLLTSTSCLLGFSIISSLIASVPTLISSKKSFGFGVKGAKDKTVAFSDSFFSFLFPFAVALCTGEILTCATEFRVHVRHVMRCYVWAYLEEHFSNILT